MYQHIEFIDGSNPYISKTEKDFKWMCEHYVLIPIAENFWKATDRIYYKVVGFADKNKMATFNRNYKSKAGAMRVICKAIKENKFECIVLRKEVEDLRNDEHFDISVSTPIKTWNLVQIGVMEMKNNDYPIYFKSKDNDIYASYDGVRWFWYGNMECCQ